MKIEFFLAKKIRNTKNQAFSSTVVKVGIASISIGVSVILLSFSILLGFKSKIKEKLFSMSAQMQISKITLNQSFEENPFAFNSELKSICSQNENISAYNPVGLKSAILKSETEISGVLLKGIDENYHWEIFEENLKTGKKLNFDKQNAGKEIIISENLANLLACKTGDDVLIYFIQNPPRARKVKIVGTYNTGISELDNSYCLIDLSLIQKINNWDSTQVGHIELFLKDFDQMELTQKAIYEDLPQDLKITNITQSLSQFFDWFNLLDRNIVIVIILIISVAGFNMVSVLLIMIMERSPMIGLLKSLGMPDFQIRNIFFTNAFQIILKGLPIGNAIAFGFGLLQYHFHLIPLDPENYYMNNVPISWNFGIWLGVNAGVIFLVSLFIIIPTLFISKIEPVSALKYKD